MIKAYPEMNEKIVGILRLGGQAEQYAAQYIEELRAENAVLRERLDRAVELPRVECIMTREWLSRELIGAIMFEWCVLYKKGSYLMAEPCLSKGAAEIRLAELKGGER